MHDRLPTNPQMRCIWDKVVSSTNNKMLSYRILKAFIRCMTLEGHSRSLEL